MGMDHVREAMLEARRAKRAKAEAETGVTKSSEQPAPDRTMPNPLVAVDEVNEEIDSMPDCMTAIEMELRNPDAGSDSSKCDEQDLLAPGAAPEEDLLDVQAAIVEAGEILEKTELEIPADNAFWNASGFHRNRDIRLYLSEPPGPEATAWEYKRFRVALFMDSMAVKIALVALILSNAVIIGVQTDYGDGSTGWLAVEMFFLFAFTVELILNVTGFGKLFFTDSWNLLDFFIVVTSLLDFVMYLAAVGEGNSGTSVARLIRVMRVVRVLRIITFLEKLATLVTAFAMGMINAGWVMLLITIACYIFAVLGKTFFGMSEGPLCPHPDCDPNNLRNKVWESSEQGYDLDMYFGSIPKTLLTLVQLFTFDDAMGLQRAIGEEAPISWFYWFTFMILVSIGLMELMTSIFIDSLLEAKAEHEREKTKRDTRVKIEVKNFIKGLFDAFDTDGDDHLDNEELEAAIKLIDTPATQKLLEAVEIDQQLMKASLRLADTDGNGLISKEEFEAALSSMNDTPTVADIREVLQRIQAVKTGTVSKIEQVEARLTSLEEKMDMVLQAVQT